MRILLTTNGKRHSEEAIRFACELFAVFNPSMTLLYIGQKSAGELATKVGLSIIREHGLPAVIQTIESNAIAQTIISERQNGRHDLLVVGSRGFSSTIPGVSNYVLGDVPREIVKAVKSSILIVEEPEKIKKVLIAVDGSEGGERVVSLWGLIAGKNKWKREKWENPKVSLLTVIPEDYHHFAGDHQFHTEEELLALGRITSHYTRDLNRAHMTLLQNYEIDAQKWLREGNVAHEILKESEKAYDLLILGRDGTKDYTFGANLLEIVEQAKTPVFIAKPGLVKSLLESQ